jgi:D-aminopeptidase
VHVKYRVIPSSDGAEKKTASSCPHAGQAASRVHGSVGSARTSWMKTVRSRAECVISLRYTHQAEGGASSRYPQLRQTKVRT